MTNDPLSPVLIATALDEDSDVAVRTGLAWAAALERPARLMHVMPNFWGTDPATDWALAAALPTPEELTERMHLQAARTQPTDSTTAVAVSCQIATGSTHHAVAEEATRQDARLIVVGAHARQHDGFPSLGNTTDRLVRLADRPLLVAREAARVNPARRVLCAVDMSPLSEEALTGALSLLTSLQGPPPVIDVVFVLGFFEGLALRNRHRLGPVAADSELLRVATDELAQLLARVAPDAARRPTGRVIEGDPKIALVDQLTTGSYDLLVVGTHGRSGFDRLLTGSVTSSLLRRVPCDTLVIPPRAARAKG